MSIIKEAVEYIVGLKKLDATVLVGNKEYRLGSDGTIDCLLSVHDQMVADDERQRQLQLDNPMLPIISTTTIKSIIDYVNGDPDRLFEQRDLMPMIHIESPTRVTLCTQADCLSRRVPLITADAITPNIPFDRAMDIENFIITMQSCFAHTDDKEALLRLVSKITSKDSETIKDDGVSQRVEVRSGVATIGEEKVPNPVTLAPFRTFIEVPQPESYYVFRVHEGPRAALYTAGGAEWQIQAMANVESHLRQGILEKSVHIIS